VQTAIDHAPSGSTIVVRGGTYHESVVVPVGKRLTIQSYPKEAVWLDGSETVTGWKRNDGTWFVSGWAFDFDSSPSYTRGGHDGVTPGWRWLSADRPLAAHPDQVWVDGSALVQVGSVREVTAGTFFVDTLADRLYIGTDPTGREVQASTLTKALSIRGEGTVVRGIGVRGYATSIWMMGAVTVEAADVTLENLNIEDNAATGLFIGASRATVRSVTVGGNGLLGLGANHADLLSIHSLLAVENNAEGFNRAPVSGGMKVTGSRELTVTDSAFLRNDGPGLWTDQSTYDAVVDGSDFVANAGTGSFFELSQRVVFVNNVLISNQGSGVKVNNTGDVRIWSNSVIGGNRTINIVQDDRSADDPSVPGHDSRRPLPDPTTPWISSDISIGNNVIVGGGGECVLCIEDYSGSLPVERMGVHSDGNLFQRPTSVSPPWVVLWGRDSTAQAPAFYATVPAFTAATGQDPNSAGIDGFAVTDPSGRLLPTVRPGVSLRVPPAEVRAVLGPAPTLGATFP